MANAAPGPLPYTDTKPQGSADFYFATNATFRFILHRLGHGGWIRYLTDLGREYYAPVNIQWRQGGLKAVAVYWRAFFAAEPGAEVKVTENPDSVTLDVAVCPAIAHLRKSGREILPEFCHHCYFVSEAAAQEAGYTIRVEGGAGSCIQTFHTRENAPPPQNLAAVRLNEAIAPNSKHIPSEATTSNPKHQTQNPKPA
jgi:hypothetical protein